MTRRRLRIGPLPTAMALVLAAACLAPGEAARADAADASAPTVNAVWVDREFSFTYMGIGTYYSCDGLRDKIKYILEEVGARAKPKVTVPCMDGTGVQFMPMARIRVTMPAEATPELMARLADEKSRRELVGRVQGKDAGTDDATAQFPAERRVVEFDGQRGRRIEDGDCALLEQLLPQVLEPLGVQKLPDSTLMCVPRQATLGAVQLKLQTLQAVPAPALSQATP